MTIQQLYDIGIQMGIKADPREEIGVANYLKRQKKIYEELSGKKKQTFDKESLVNPYSDSRILYGNPNKEVKKILAGIDGNASEVLLVDRLNQKGAKIDLLLVHHPEGHALASLHEVMDLQIEMYEKSGVPANIAYSLMQERISEVQRRISPVNHTQSTDAARLLDIPLISLHTVWDNLGNNFMNKYVENRKFDIVGDLYDYLLEIPEYKEAIKAKAGPQIVSGSEKSRAGKVAVFFTGGTNPSKEMYIEWARAGVGTVIDMHIPEEALKELRKLHVNVINCGHMASDSIGGKIYLDVIEKKGIEIVAGVGLIRVKRI